MLKISPCLLSTNNRLEYRGQTLGALIDGQHKTALWEPRCTKKIDTLVIHYSSAVERMPGNPFQTTAILAIYCEYGVSCHYFCTREGEVLQLVPEEQKAWHCGPSIMPEPDNRTGVNDFSIGIECVATPDSGFTAQQYASLGMLMNSIQTRYEGPFWCVGHEDVAGRRAVEEGLRQDPKQDPGSRFDWEGLQRRCDSSFWKFPEHHV